VRVRDGHVAAPIPWWAPPSPRRAGRGRPSRGSPR
jgi:hypothetical protein